MQWILELRQGQGTPEFNVAPEVPGGLAGPGGPGSFGIREVGMRDVSSGLNLVHLVHLRELFEHFWTFWTYLTIKSIGPTFDASTCWIQFCVTTYEVKTGCSVLTRSLLSQILGAARPGEARPNGFWTLYDLLCAMGRLEKGILW